MSDAFAHSFFLLFFPYVVGYCFYRDYRYEKLVNEKEAVYAPGSGRITAGYASPEAILWTFPTILALVSLLSGWRAGLAFTGEMALRLMAVALVYYPLLLLALPLLRRVFSARCCAVLGTLPAFLFVSGGLQALFFFGGIPRVVIRLPKALLPALIGVWLAGGGAILLWKTVGHLRFRQELLSGAREVTDGEILELWDYEQQRIERKKGHPIPLAVSPKAVSPLTIGLGRDTLVTVLPEREYTLDELELIFRHELRHVQRKDSGTKLFYTFCLAFCWFDPFLWLVYHGATADLELSCDEMVLDRSDGERREKYARLLLSQAGDDRGFSTCLSGSERALERRLKSVLHPRRKLTGAVLVGLVMAGLLAVGSAVRITGTYGTVVEVVLDRLPETAVEADIGGEAWDEEGLMEVLNSLEVTRLTTMGRFPSGTHLTACLYLRSPEDREGQYYSGVRLWFSEDGYLEVLDLAVGPRSRGVEGLYRVEGAVDWEALRITE